jgi:hypothetical protein
MQKGHIWITLPDASMIHSQHVDAISAQSSGGPPMRKVSPIEEVDEE